MPARPSLTYASEFDRSGYATAGKRYMHALRTVGHDFAWRPLAPSSDGRLPTDDLSSAPAWMVDLPRDADEDSQTIWHLIPHTWPELRRRYPSGKFIGQTVWEAERIPQRWRTELAVADEIWVPTRWNAAVIEAAGVGVPVRVVPHAVEWIAPEAPPLQLDPERAVFLTISTWEWRKRPDLTIHAYLRAFTSDDPVVLVVKSTARIQSWDCASSVERNTWWQVMQIVRQYPKPAEVVLVTDVYTDAQMAGLISSARCFVSLTCTEGWGLGAFDATAAGVPVVITGWGGQLEWLGMDHPGLVPYRLVDAVHQDRTMFEPGMKWAIADVDAAAKMMRAVLDSTSPLIDAAPALARRMRETYSPEAIGHLMTELLA